MAISRKNIRVLVVDDSTLARDMLRSILESEPGIVVVGEAADGAEAVASAAALKPDIITMDLEMPVLGGLDAIERIIADNPVPILVVTALTGVRTAFAAVSKGALDVIEKPDISEENSRKLIKKILLLANVDVIAHRAALGKQRSGTFETVAAPQNRQRKGGIIVIAASTGGPQAIEAILAGLPAAMPVPIIITQHIAEGFTQGMVDWLNVGTPLSVLVAVHGDRLSPGRVYVNPAEYSMQISEQGMIILGARNTRQLYNPSCNTLLTSVAAGFRERTIGLIMSGMGDDGVAGMQAIKKAGGFTLAQDAKSSVIYGMNRIAVERGCIDKVLGLPDIPLELMRLTGDR